MVDEVRLAFIAEFDTQAMTDSVVYLRGRCLLQP